ncbi:MAG: hypothetical protein IKP49_06200 [Treponema sp.]|nr:hypothetical protein [Treponema sp.]
MENGKYTSAQVLQAGKEITQTLLELANSSNNISGFLKGYLSKLNSSDGIFKRQQDAMQKFADSSRHIQDEANEIVSTSRENGEEIKSICQEFNELNKDITEIQKRRQLMNDNVARLNKEIDEISEFIKKIQDVAAQINLLSFNASIEAARAGEAGKGFRIIANEVKRLSDSTASLSNSMKLKMSEVQDRIKDVVSENSAHNGFMDDLQKTAMDSNTKLEKINSDSERNITFTETMVKQIAENQEQIITATNESEKQNIEQVKDIANKAAINSIHLGDQLSFIFELESLFNYIEKNNMLR